MTTVKTTLQTVAASSSPEVQMNDNFQTLSAVGIFGRRQPVTTGLTWGYYGGIYNGVNVDDGTVTLTDATTNYVVVHRTTGVVSTSTAATNFNNTATYARLYKIVTASGAVSTVEDHRMNTGGLLNAGALSVGRHAIFIPAAAMQPSVTNGCAALATVATTSGQPDMCTLDFDTTTQEFAQFAIAMPKSWDEGTVTFLPIWSHAATTTNFGAVWQLQGLAVSDNEAIPQNFGTAVTSTDTGGTTNNLYRAPESAAITIAGTPAAEDMVFFRLGRVPANASDTLAIDARLHGIVLYINTDAGTDA